MSYLYVCEHGAVIGIEGNRFQVKYKNGEKYTSRDARDDRSVRKGSVNNAVY